MIVIQVPDKYVNASWLTNGSLSSESVTKVATPIIQSNIWSETELGQFLFSKISFPLWSNKRSKRKRREKSARCGFQTIFTDMYSVFKICSLSQNVDKIIENNVRLEHRAPIAAAGISIVNAWKLAMVAKMYQIAIWKTVQRYSRIFLNLVLQSKTYL